MPKQKRTLDPTPIYYVYVLMNWLGIPFYVGKGKGNRAYSHWQRSDKRNWLKNEMIELTWTILEDIPVIIVNDNLTEEQAFQLEVSLIKTLGRIDNGTGKLTNLTDGGEGVSGYVVTPDDRKRISEQNKRYMASLDPLKRRQIIIDMWAAMTPERRRQIAIDRNAKMGPVALSARAYKINQNQTPEQRRNRQLRANAKLTPEQRSQRSFLSNSRQTPEERSKRQHRAMMEGMTAKERSERARKVMENLPREKVLEMVAKMQAGLTPEIMQTRAKRLNSEMSTETRKANAHKAWETKRTKIKLRQLLLLLFLSHLQIAAMYRLSEPFPFEDLLTI